MDFLRDFLSQQKIPTNDPAEEVLEPGQFEYTNDYSAWSIVQDMGIHVGPKYPHCYGIEVVTPVFVTEIGERISDFTGPWQFDIERVWASIEKYFEVVTEYNHQCGTHVHFSPLNGFTTDQVRRVAHFLTDLDESITDHIPKERRMSSFIKPNFEIRSKPSLKGLKNSLGLQDIVDLMMPRQEDMCNGLADRKYVAWNFLPLQGATGTIEFRQPPHVNNVTDAEDWVQTALYLYHRGLNWS
ncbi:uncharacterized protein FTOL_11885 [Fusarium torulosum]|uniref:Amidoligase enzyme n=1 Tax=Fusarium torulosum TaxID=33205 RepID=A0AAE8MKR5_9HYPO|nr:uncharacterized protein FTOL_11885 [Fusarium torulosum]